MNIDNNNIDPKYLENNHRIDAYLKGAMSKEEEQQFFKDIETEPELKSKAIAMARLVKGLKEVGAAQDKDVTDALLASSEEGIVQVAKDAIRQRKARTISFTRLSTLLSIAASLILVVWLCIGYQDARKAAALADEYMDAFGNFLIARGSDDASETEQKLTCLFDNIRKKTDLDNTLHELSLCWELSTMDIYNDYTNYSAEIGWNLAIAYLKDNDRKGAKKVLEELMEKTEDGSTINMKTKELLEKL